MREVLLSSLVSMVFKTCILYGVQDRCLMQPTRAGQFKSAVTGASYRRPYVSLPRSDELHVPYTPRSDFSLLYLPKICNVMDHGVIKAIYHQKPCLGIPSPSQLISVSALGKSGHSSVEPSKRPFLAYAYYALCDFLGPNLFANSCTIPSTN